FEGQAQQRIFRTPFHAGPRAAAAFRTVGAGAGYVNERHLRVEPGQSFSRRQSDSVRDAFVFLGFHPGGRDSKTKETSTERRELRFDRSVVPEIAVDDLPQPRVLCARLASPDGQNRLHPRIEKAFAQDALPDHACGSKENYLHWFLDEAMKSDTTRANS